ncbi:MAG: hypothetical protein FWC38_07215 [Proteobacteria bacterium]|nr:hypothetical protein [Pseudomonadota bacterium]MCL2307993.1 hypothetical protein [Pseudomonadota bacterium]
MDEQAVMTADKRLSRWQAAAIHLSISCAIALLVLVFIRFVFYPDFYFRLSGGLKLFFLIVGVDVVVGPLLTLAVYKHGKKGLKFDLSVIAALQVMALAYGLHTMWIARPVYTVFAIDHFAVISASEIVQESLEKAKPEYQKLPLWGPRFVAVEMPSSPEEKQKLLFSALSSGADVQSFPEYYVPYQEKQEDILEKARLLQELEKAIPESRDEIKMFLKRKGGVGSDYRYLPIRGMDFILMTMVVDQEGVPVGVIPVDPEPEVPSVSSAEE